MFGQDRIDFGTETSFYDLISGNIESVGPKKKKKKTRASKSLPIGSRIAVLRRGSRVHRYRRYRGYYIIYLRTHDGYFYTLNMYSNPPGKSVYIIFNKRIREYYYIVMPENGVSRILLLYFYT